MKKKIVLLIVFLALLLAAPVAAKTAEQAWMCWENQSCYLRVRPGSTTWIRADCESAEFVQYGDSWMFVCN